MAVLFLQAGEHVALECVLLHVADARLDLALVPGRARLGRQNGQTVMLGKRTQLGIQLRIKPVRLLDAGFQVVEHQHLRHAAEVMKGILQTAQKLLAGLTPDRLAVAFARVTEDDAKDVRAPPAAVRLTDGRAAAEIHLGLFARSTLHAPKWQRLVVVQTAHKATHAVILAGEAVLARQVLVDALRRQSGRQLVEDDLAPRLTQARLLRRRGRSGRGRRCRALDGAQLGLGRGPFHADERLAYFDRRADGRLAYFGALSAPWRVAYFAVLSAPVEGGLFWLRATIGGTRGWPAWLCRKPKVPRHRAPVQP